MILAGLFLLAILLSIWMFAIVWARIVRRRVSLILRIVTPIVDDGDFIPIECTIVNTTWLPIPYVRCSIELPVQLFSGNPIRAHFLSFTTYLLPRQQLMVTQQVKAVRRGYGRLVSAKFTLGEGLGMTTVHHTVPLMVGVTVRPAPRLPFAWPVPLTELIGDLQIRRFYHEDPSFLQNIRPYRPGDDFRHIAWRATARVNQIMTKQFATTTNSRCLLVLSGYADRRMLNPRVLDRLCESVVQLAESLLHEGFTVGLYMNLFDNIFRNAYEPPSGGVSQLQRIRTRMGSLESIPFATLVDLLRVVPSLTDPADTIVVLTGQIESKAASLLTDLKRVRPHLQVYVVHEPSRALPDIVNVPTHIDVLESDPVRSLG